MPRSAWGQWRRENRHIYFVRAHHSDVLFEREVWLLGRGWYYTDDPWTHHVVWSARLYFHETGQGLMEPFGIILGGDILKHYAPWWKRSSLWFLESSVRNITFATGPTNWTDESTIAMPTVQLWNFLPLIRGKGKQSLMRGME